MMKKVNWDDIPSLENLEVDWEYSPENPLGKRAWVRISNSVLYRLFEVKLIPVKIVSKTFSKTGKLLDISPRGLAVVVDSKIEDDAHVNVGFFLGKRKVTSKAVVKNSSNFDNGFRVGIEFVELKEDHVSYITELNAFKVHGH